MLCCVFRLSCRIEPTETQLREQNGKTKRETVSESDETHRLYAKTTASKTNSQPMRPSSSLIPQSANLNPKSASLNLPSKPFRSPSPNRKDFVPGHRKVKSLGST